MDIQRVTEKEWANSWARAWTKWKGCPRKHTHTNRHTQTLFLSLSQPHFQVTYRQRHYLQLVIFSTLLQASNKQALFLAWLSSSVTAQNCGSLTRLLSCLQWLTLHFHHQTCFPLCFRACMCICFVGSRIIMCVEAEIHVVSWRFSSRVCIVATKSGMASVVVALVALLQSFVSGLCLFTRSSLQIPGRQVGKKRKGEEIWEDEQSICGLSAPFRSQQKAYTRGKVLLFLYKIHFTKPHV